MSPAGGPRRPPRGDPPGAAPKDRPVTPVGTRVVWTVDEQVVCEGRVTEHVTRARVLTIKVRWDGDRGVGRFLDNSWPRELTPADQACTRRWAG